MVRKIVEDIKYRNIDEDPQPFLYLSLEQSHISMVSLHIRTTKNPISLSGSIYKLIRQLDPNLPVEIRTLEQRVAGSLGQHKLITGVVGIFGLLALALALIGVYGIVSYSVGQRAQEMGIRSALGASKWELLRLVLRKTVLIIVVGIGLGLIGAFFSSHLLVEFLYQTQAIEPIVFVVVASAMAAVALLASLLPARKAALVDPIIAIRNIGE